MTIQAQLADGRVLEFPDGTDPSVIQATVKRVVSNPLAGQSTEALESAKSAPMSFGDVAKSLSSGVIGGGKSLVDFFGAGTGISKGLGEAQSYLQESLSPERKEEIARRQELQERAAKSGSLFQEAKAYIGGVTEAPIQSLAQAAGSSAPAIITSIAALPASAPAALALGVGTIAKLTVGAIQGVGEYKGSVFDAVKAEYMKQGKSEQEAEALALKSQEYSRDKAFEIGGSALLGALDAVTGAEPSVAKAMRKASPTGALTKEAIEKGVAALPEKAVKAPSYLGQFGRGIATEAPLEGAQGAFGQYGENVALQQAGADVTPMQGVLGAGLRDATVGALFGGAASPLGMRSARQDYATDQMLRQAKEDIELDKRAAELEKTKQQAKEGLGATGKQLLLPAPGKKYEEPKDLLQDPVGRITEDELGKAIGDNTVVNYLNKYRRDNNLPKLKSYSVEDIKDAMTAQNPEGEEGALNSILAYKTGYKDETYTPEDINNVAVAKNVATETKGFSDFLTRATGKSDLNTMTQPQLHSVAKALEALPRTGKEEQLVLPEGSNATRFTQDQYNQGVTTALMGVKQGKPVSLDQARNAVKAQTDLKTDRDADQVLKTAASNEDLIIERGTGFQATNKTGEVLGIYGTEAEAKRNHRRADITPVETQLVRAPEEIKTEKIAKLPEGYGIEKTAEVGEERPAAYVLREEGSTKNASQTFAEEVDVKRHQELLVRKREANAAAKDAEADRIRKQLEAQEASIAQMEADGLTGTAEHTKAVNTFKAANVSKSDQITKLVEEAQVLRTPLKIVPLGKKTVKVEKHTVTKGGKKLGTFPNKTEAEKSILSQADEQELQTIADRGGVMGKRAETELGERKRTAPGIKVKGTAEGLEKAGVRTPETEAKLKELETKLKPMLDKFGLGDVALNVVRAIENNAEGSYIDKLIKIAFDAKYPIRTMRHEAIHALKELGFFTPQQWKALERQAKDTWIDKYLKGVQHSDKMTRFDAYKAMGLSDAEITEEAIADAFADFDTAGKAPAGMLEALFKRLQQFFAALRQALTGAGFESAEEIFGKIERGEMIQRGKPTETIGERLSLLREAYPDETEISTQNPQGVKRTYDPITQMLSIDEEAVREAMKANPDLAKRTIQAIKAYGFIPKGTPNNKVLEVFKQNIVNNLMFLYRSVPERIRQRSKLWYDGANKIATEMADEFDVTMEQVAGIMAAMSPQKDWFQNVSMAERALDVLTMHGNKAWDENMLKYARSYVAEAADRKEREKRQDAFEKIKAVAEKGTTLEKMDAKEAAAFIRAYDEAYHSREYRIVTPEGGFGDLVRNLDGKPSTLMWSTYGPIEKTVNIYRDGSRKNISQQLGFEHKIRSFYNNIAAPNSDISHVTIDTHAVAAGLFEALAGTDPEVAQNFGATGSSDVIGVGGTYGLIADAYREAAQKAGIRAREMQSITWEAVRGLFTEEMKSSIKPKVRAEWAKYKNGEQSFDETRQNVIEIAGGFTDPDWVGSGIGSSVENGGTSYDKSFVPEGGVRLREAKELREKLTFNLSAVTDSIPGLRELYQRAMGKDKRAYEVLQKVAESSLSYLLSGTNARVNVEYAKGVYLSDREPSISVSVSFDENETQQVMAALSKFAESYNQQQIHVRQPTIRKVGHEFPDGSYATVVYQIPLKKELNNVRISEIIEQSGLAGFTVTPDTLTAYWVKGKDNDQSSFDSFKQQVTSVHELVGARNSRPKQTVERLFVYGEGYGARIGYFQIAGDVRPKQSSDTKTPRIIAEYLTGEPVTTFKQKPLTQAQTKDQELLAEVFDELPVNDLKNPLVKRAYKALTNALLEQYNVLPIKVILVDSTAEPYANSAEMREDVSKRNRFRVYKTTPETFGPPGSDFRGHPLLQDSGLTDVNGTPMLYNDLLRAVHDYFAHNLSEAEFGPKGEMAAWRNHMAVTNDPLARWALTVETRAQNAWQNFRRGAQGLTLMQRGFADQKASLPPVNFTLTGDAKVDQPMVDYIGTLSSAERLGSLSSDSSLAKKAEKNMPKFSLRTYFPTAEEAENAAYEKAPPGTAEFKRFFGGSKVTEEGRPQVMYHGSLNDFSQFNEDNRKGLIFVTPNPAFAEEYALLHASRMEKQAEPPVKVYPLWVRAETPFDYENPDHVTQVMQSLGGSMGMNEYIQTEKEVKEGNWAKIEDPRFVAALKKLGFDSLYVKENKTKNLAVFKANQVKSVTGNIGEFGENKDIRYSLRDATNMFDPAEVEKLSQTAYKSRYKLINMDIEQFLRLANFGKQESKMSEAQGRISKGEKFTSIPYLYVEREGGDLYVTGHEGRHRARALQAEGFETMPVEIRSGDGIRWSEQDDPEKFDYIKTWPKKIYAQKDALSSGYSIPMPFTRQESPENYKASQGGQKFSLKPVSADIDAAIDRTTTAREEQGFIGRILEAIFPKSAGHFRQQALNRYNQLGVNDKKLAETMGGAALLADQSAESAALMSDLSASVTASAFGYGNRTGGVPVYKNGLTTIDTSVKGPIAILAPLAKYNNPRIYQRYQYWAGVKRGKRFMADGKEKNFEQADIARAAQLEKDHPEFVQIQKEMNEFNNGLVKYMVQTGVLDPARAKAYMEHADYIPFYRQMDGDRTIGPNIFQSISGVKPPKALKGSEAPIADYLETIVRNTQSAIQSGMKNVAAQRAVDVAVKIKMAQRLNTQDSGPDTVQVLEKGVRVSYRTADPLFIDACRSLNLPDLPFIGLLSGPADFLRNFVTKDPGFMLANLMRDSLSSWVTSGTNMTPIIGTMSGFVKALSGKSASMEALLNAGVLGGYEFSSGVLKSGEVLAEDMNKKYGKATGAKVLLKPFTSLWDALEKGTEASDAATRIAIYERVLAETGNEAEAIFRSLEVMNFNRKGSSAIIRIATAAIPFLNARMQGLDIFYRTAFGRDTVADPAAKQRAFFVRGATLMALSIAAYIMVSDDDEYKKQEEETKDNYWIIPGVGKFPTPFEVGFLFKTVPERIYATMFKDDTGEDLKESMKRGLISTLAFNPMPQTFKPIAEAMVNYNSFTGRVIVGAGMEGRSPEFQVGPGTSEVAKQLGSALGLSPLKIDHILQGYTGTIGMYLVQATDSVLSANDNSPNASKRFEQLPIIKRFAVDPEARGNITQFYALKNATDQAVTTLNFLERSGDAEAYAKYFEENAGILANKNYVNSIEKQMKSYREMRAMIQSAEMTGDEKRDILIDIGRAENALNENIKEVKKAIKELQ
jgi:hypothetical protein